MAKNLTVEEKLEKGARALEMSGLGFSKSAIAREVGVNRKTVESLIEIGAEDADLGDIDLERSRAKAHYQRIIRDVWRAVKDKSLNANSHNIPAFYSQLLAAQSRLDKLNGVEAPELHLHGHKISVADIARTNGHIPPEKRLRLVDEDLGETG